MFILLQTPQVPTIIVPPITKTTDNNSDIETHGAGASTEEIYEVVSASVVNDDIVYEIMKSEEGPSSHSYIYNDTD